MQNLDIVIEDKTFANGLCTMADLQFTARAGEFVAIVGPSGTGKSTLLNMVAGLDQPTVGAIRADQQPFAAHAHKLAFMFQEPRLMPWLDTAANIELVCDANESLADFRQRMDRLLAEVGVADFKQSFPRQLSGGMQRRVALVRAFVGQPDILLMDEPFQSLDAPTAQQLRELMLRLWQEHKPLVLFVTHSLSEALMLADRILFLSARPASVILDYPLAEERPRCLDTIRVLEQALLTEHPQILSGELGLGKKSHGG